MPSGVLHGLPYNISWYIPDKPTSSPDTGFAEDDIQEMPENPDSVETEKLKTITEPGRFKDKHLLNKTQLS